MLCPFYSTSFPLSRQSLSFPFLSPSLPSLGPFPLFLPVQGFKQLQRRKRAGQAGKRAEAAWRFHHRPHPFPSSTTGPSTLFPLCCRLQRGAGKSAEEGSGGECTGSRLAGPRRSAGSGRAWPVRAQRRPARKAGAVAADGSSVGCTGSRLAGPRRRAGSGRGGRRLAGLRLSASSLELGSAWLEPGSASLAAGEQGRRLVAGRRAGTEARRWPASRVEACRRHQAEMRRASGHQGRGR